MTQTSPKTSQSELEFGQKVDRCLADSLIKLGGGLGVGLGASLLFFKSKRPGPCPTSFFLSDCGLQDVAGQWFLAQALA
jgi:hypothetical protein